MRINFVHVSLLVKDAWRTQSWRDKFRIWFMPTGWRPADVKTSHPVYAIEDVFDFKKYETMASQRFMVWIWIQLGVLLIGVSYLFGNLAAIGSPGIFLYGAFIFIYVYAMTESMDGHAYAWIPEGVKLMAGFALLGYYHDWFAVGKFIPQISWWVAGYLLLSFGVTVYFCVITKKQKAQLVIAS